MKLKSSVGAFAKALIALSLVLSSAAGCGGSDSTPPVTVLSIAVSPATASIAVGATQAFKATATFSDATTKDISASAIWSSSVLGTATVSATGLATGVAAGTSLITAASGAVTGHATLVVVAVTQPVTLTSITVTPVTASIGVGATQQFVATGKYDDGSMKDLSATAVWTSSVPATGTVSASGLATGVAAGVTVITATSGALSGAATLTVTPPVKPAVLLSVAVAPENGSIGVGTTRQFAATGTYDDGTTKDLTATATWLTSNPATATVSMTGLATALAKGATVISATSGGITGMTTLTVTAPAKLLSIALTPANPTIAKGTTVQLTAIGTYDDGVTMDVSSMATWTSSVAANATVSAAGLVTGVASGAAAITATIGTVTASTTVTVTVAVLTSIAVSPDMKTIATGTTQQFTAIGTFMDPTTSATTTQDLTKMVTWVSQTVATATITAGGLATAKAVGTTVITATSGTVVGMTTLTVKKADLVSIAVTTPTPSIAKGTTATFVATGTFADMTTQNLTSQVTWVSSIPGTATITNLGVATALGKGTTRISATLGTVTGSLILTVTDAALVSIAVSAELLVASATPKIAKNTKVQLNAIGTFSDQSKQDLTETVTWASSTNAATVSNAAGTRGLVTAGNAAGTTVLSAQVGTGATAIRGTLTLIISNETLVSIAVTPATITIAAGTTQQFTATGFFTDTSRQDLTETVAWTSATPARATISNATGSKGLARGLTVGSSVLTASFGTANPVTATATLTVSQALLQAIAISPATPTVAMGTTLTLGAQGTYSDGSKQDLTTAVTWASATTTVATISNAAGSNGKVTPVAKGTSVITATFTISPTQMVTGTATLTVSDAVLKSLAVTAASATTIERGTTVQLTATGTFTDGTTVDLTKAVTWGSDKTTVATVSNASATAGLVTAVATGAATISATSTAPSMTGQPVVGSLGVTVNDGELVSIAVTPATPAIAAGTKLQFVAIGTFDDGAKQDITDSVTWGSDTGATATIDSAGLATAVAAGTTKVTATQGTGATAISGNTTLTVTAAKLLSIVLSPQAPVSIAKGTTVQFTATGFFDDTTTQNLTDTATWASAMNTIATVSNAAASNGLATGNAMGTANITARVVIDATTITSAPVALTVTAATLVSVAITPATPSVAKGAALNLIATGTFTDGSTQVMTNAVTWASAATATATVSNAFNQHGRATGVAVGTVDISATSDAASGSKVGHVTLTVTPVAVASIAVTPATPAPTVARNATRQFTATATMTDGTLQNITAAGATTWTSSVPANATISAAGLATGVAVGTTQISATSGSVTSNKVTLTVN